MRGLPAVDDAHDEVLRPLAAAAAAVLDSGEHLEGLHQQSVRSSEKDSATTVLGVLRERECHNSLNI